MVMTQPSHRPAAPPLPEFYAPLPRRMIEDLRDTPVAIAVYALVARLTLISGQPIPLSPGDLLAYDPTLSYGAGRRAIDRLVDSGYLVVASDGRKRTFTPSWGHVHDAPLLWQHGKPSLGRPRHIAALRLDERLLDLCIGRLDPHPIHRAVVERYLATPLLGLREIGAYALALAGLPVNSPALQTLGLLDADGSPLPLPDERTVLAAASQRTELTPAGWCRAGFTPTPPGSAPTAPGQPLFFVPRGAIGSVIGSMIGPQIAHPIGQPPEEESPGSASERAETPPPPEGERSHRSTDQTESTTTRPPLTEAGPRGGGGDSDHPPTPAGPPAPPAPPVNDSPTMCLLRSIGVRADVAARLASRPAAQVTRVIAGARARRDVRDLAGWVVSALRALPEDGGEPAPDRPVSVAPIYDHPGLDADQRSDWLMRFRRAQTPYEQRAVLARLEREHPSENTGGVDHE